MCYWMNDKNFCLHNDTEISTSILRRCHICCDFRVAILEFVSGKDCTAALERNPAVLIGDTNCPVDWYFPAPEDGIVISCLSVCHKCFQKLIQIRAVHLYTQSPQSLLICTCIREGENVEILNYMPKVRIEPESIFLKNPALSAFLLTYYLWWYLHTNDIF